MTNVLVTGAAGFIGFHLCRRLIGEGFDVTGIDNFNDYYDPQLKQNRLAQIYAMGSSSFHFYPLDIRNDIDKIENIIRNRPIKYVFHLAAQAGVRYSVNFPEIYTQNNLVGFFNILQACRVGGYVDHLFYASSSSVYGNVKEKCREDADTNNPLSYYAATKKANEVMAHSYFEQFGLECTGMRFFSVYGPWGRPDMVLWKFTEAIAKNIPVILNNDGRNKRDFTYIDDVVEAMFLMLKYRNKLKNNYLPEVVNIGNGNPMYVTQLLKHVEDALGMRAERNVMPAAVADVPVTWSDNRRLQNLVNWSPKIHPHEGVGRFVEWYRHHYGV